MKTCAICGSNDIIRQENQQDTVEFKVGNKKKPLNLTGLSWSKCQNCGECYLNPQDCKIESHKILEALKEDRIKRGLLTAEEIKEIRESLGYTQDQLDKLLGLGSKSFARWETYKVDQSKSADLLLRAIKKGGKDFLIELINERKIA